MPVICQDSLPVAAWMAPATRRLPGIQPLDPAAWLQLDERYAAQMAYRDRLIAEVPATVHALAPAARPAAGELLDRVLAELARLPGFERRTGALRRPDGVTVPIDRTRPLITAGRLVQEDLCLVEKRDGAHVLTGAVLCFPASWSLEEKFLRPLDRIHRPVAAYTPDLARRVDRLFDAIRPEQPLWRANALLYADPELHQPRRETDPRSAPPGGKARYLRAERQCLLRLPETRAVVFSIHSYVVPRDRLTAAQRAGLAAHPVTAA